MKSVFKSSLIVSAGLALVSLASLAAAQDVTGRRGDVVLDEGDVDPGAAIQLLVVELDVAAAVVFGIGGRRDQLDAIELRAGHLHTGRVSSRVITKPLSEEIAKKVWSRESGGVNA